MTKTKNLSDKIRHLSPCSDAMAWLAYQPSAAKAWQSCERGDWMLWLIGRLVTSPPWSDDRKPLLACCLDCAETVKHLWPEKQRGKIADAVGVLRRWIDGTATVDEAKEARRQLYSDADAAYAAADAAAYAAAYAADADADAAYADAARQQTLKACADIVRKHFPKPPKVKESIA